MKVSAMHCEQKTIEGQSTIQDNTVTSSNEEYGYRFGLTEELKQFIVFPKPMFHMLVFKKNLFHNMGIYPFIALTSLSMNLNTAHLLGSGGVPFMSGLHQSTVAAMIK